MTRHDAAHFAKQTLIQYGLSDWSVRYNQDANSHFLGLCSYRDKTIILSAHHVDIHPDPDIRNTILHEVAHALCNGHGHDEVWSAKAREIGCDNTLPCSNLTLDASIIDAIRSGASVEVTFEEQVIRTPKFTVTRLQDKCEDCGRVARTVFEHTEVSDDFHPDIRVIELECGHYVVRNLPKGTPFHTFQFGGDPKCEHKWDKNTCLICGRNQPFQYQIEGMQFGEAALAINNGVGYFDEMGVGKTLQAMGLTHFHPELQPTLWIVKSGLKYQFAKAIMNWQGVRSAPWIVDKSSDGLPPGLKNYIISYDILVPKIKTLKSGKEVKSGFDIKKFDEVGIKCVVLDECQQIKNVDASRTQMVRRVVKGRKVIALSGTPWKNKGSELFPVLNMLDYMKFSSEEKFKTQWVDYYWDKGFRKEGGIRRINQFKEYIKDIVIRRERADVLPELPSVTRTKLHIKLDKDQEEVYDIAVDEFVKWYETQVDNLSGIHILAAMAKMRHLVAIAKIPATLEFVDEFIEDTDRKLVIFLHHIDVGEMIMSDLQDKYGSDMPIIHLKGGMNPHKREELVTLFNSSQRAIMVASTLSSGEGLNLQTCSDCILHERQWNPGNEEQVEGRFIRIGQAATVVSAAYAHLEGLTTIDPQLDGIIERKRRQFYALMSNGEAPRWNESEIIKELAESIVNAHHAKKGRKRA